MTEAADIVLAVYDGFELLDMSGPASVFQMADTICGGGAYRIVLTSSQGGDVAANSGIEVKTRACAEIPLSEATTVLAVGGASGPLDAARSDTGLLQFMQRAKRAGARCGSVCTGAFIVAAAGLADGRHTATHWRDAARLQSTYPEVSVDPKRLYICDQGIWSSAGIASGIDMALAMVEQDHGRAIMTRTAKRLVVYAHRPGTQTQFSSVLDTQSAVNDRFGALLAWITDHLDQPISVGDMARHAALSERSFYRQFATATGSTPSKFLEQARLDKAKQLLEAGAPVKSVPRAVGFRSESGFRTAFEARFRISPSQHRLLHGGRRG